MWARSQLEPQDATIKQMNNNNDDSLIYSYLSVMPDNVDMTMYIQFNPDDKQFYGAYPQIGVN